MFNIKFGKIPLIKILALTGLFVISLSALFTQTLASEKKVAEAGSYNGSCSLDPNIAANSYNCRLLTEQQNIPRNTYSSPVAYSVPASVYGGYGNTNYNNCGYDFNSQLLTSTNRTSWCASFTQVGCGYFYKAQTSFSGLCSTGGDTSFDKDDIIPFEANVDCYPGGYKLYYYSRRQGGRQNYYGPLICAYYPDRSRAELRWLPQVYSVRPL